MEGVRQREEVTDAQLGVDDNVIDVWPSCTVWVVLGEWQGRLRARR